MQHSAISVVIPAYNEEKTIGAVISSTISTLKSLEMPFEIIIVDDGSTDNTRRVAACYKTTVLANGKNRGKGYSLKRGFQHANGNIIVTIDADGTHRPNEIPNLISPLFNGVDSVAGSRFLGRGKGFTSRLNRFGNLVFSLMIAVLTGKYITDSQTGFRAFRKGVLRELDLESVGFEIETEITVKTLKNGFVWEEKPIAGEKRKHGASKLKIHSDGIKIFKTILRAKFAPAYLLQNSPLGRRQSA